MKKAYLLYGENAVFIRDAEERICEKIPPGELSVYYAGENSAGHLMAEINQPALFTATQVICIRNLEEMKVSERDSLVKELCSYLDDYSTETVLILTWVLESGKKVPKKLLTAFTLSPEFEAQEYKRAYRRDIEHYLRNQFMSAGMTFDEGAIDLVIELANEDISESAMMAQLLKNYAGNKGRITIDDARSVLSRSHNLSSFDFIDGLFMKNVPKALSALSDLQMDDNEHILKVNAVLLSTAKRYWAFLAKRGSAPEVGFYQAKKFGDYKSKTNLRYVSGVLDLCARIDRIVKEYPEEFAYLEIEKFICGNA